MVCDYRGLRSAISQVISIEIEAKYFIPNTMASSSFYVWGHVLQRTSRLRWRKLRFSRHSFSLNFGKELWRRLSSWHLLLCMSLECIKCCMLQKTGVLLDHQSLVGSHFFFVKSPNIQGTYSRK